METLHSSIPILEDAEIAERVASLAGVNARILDCEKKSSLVTEEVLLLNGIPISLTGEGGEKIKAALKAGEPPPQELLSEILLRAGISQAPIQVETVTTVKTNTKSSELSTLKDSQGLLVDEKMKSFEEDDEFESTNVELWSPEQKLKEGREKMKEYYDKVRPFMQQQQHSGSNSNSPTRTTIITNETEESSKYSTFQSTKRRGGEGGSTGSSRSSTPTSPIRPNQPPPSIPTATSTLRKMPPLSPPLDPSLRPNKVRPPIPPKPNIPSGYVGNLRTDKNLTLPVRVVYETFI